VVLGGLQAGSFSLAMATPSNGRMPPEERHRLRQEVRQHSGGQMRQPMQAVPMSNSGPAPAVVPQNALPVPGPIPGPRSGATPHYGQQPIGNPAYPVGRVHGPGGGRLSEDDRRALRQQLREQQGPAREAVGGP
jgi:uncharacterized membrane protein